MHCILLIMFVFLIQEGGIGLHELDDSLPGTSSQYGGVPKLHTGIQDQSKSHKPEPLSTALRLNDFCSVGGAEDDVKPCVQKAFAYMIGEEDDEVQDEDLDDEDADDEWKDIGMDEGGGEVTPGDVLALEMELNRENKKMMKVTYDHLCLRV